MLNITLYQSHLDRVSRSFAFCIRQLDMPMRAWVSLSYLLCRILDTVEDAPWDTAAQRDAAFHAFDCLVESPHDAQRVQAWSETFPCDLPPGERSLLADAGLLFVDLQELPAAPRRAISQTVRTMSQGMQHYAAERAADGTLRLESLVDVNRYCYFVAGVVGHLLTELFVLQRDSFAPAPHLMKNAFHFGLFLQKINILKDQKADEGDGRFLIPDRTALLASVRENLEGSIDYLTALPADALDYRIFCAWSLFLGMTSLSSRTKPTRADTAALIQRVAAIAHDNNALRQELSTHLHVLPAALTDGAKDWFCALSGDALRPSELSALSVL